MASIIDAGTTDNNVTTRKLYKGADAKLMRMEPEPRKDAENTKNTASLIEQFIEENSGEYDKKKLYSVFSDKLSIKEFRAIISGLSRSGKIAIDRSGIIVWIWYPESRKEYLNPRNLVF